MIGKAISAVTKGISGVYALVNRVNGKFYIGSSVNIYNQLRDYYADRYIKNNPNLLISKAINKHGSDVFTVAILELNTEDNTLAMEQFYLDQYDPAYNILKFASRPEGYVHTDESKAKMAAKVKDRVGHKVLITDILTGKVVERKSLRKAALLLKCRQVKVAELAKSSELFRKQYYVRYK